MMDLQEQLKQAQEKVDEILDERARLIAVLSITQRALDANDFEMRKAIRTRDEAKAMMSVVPSPTIKKGEEENCAMRNRQEVFKVLRTMPDTWIAPVGLAVLSGVDDAECAAILRRAAGLDAIPVEHNGKRGRASMYRWTGGR